MEYLQTHCNVPVPKVLAWSSKASGNGVGVEYIVMEKVPGVPLSEAWSALTLRDRVKVVQKLSEIEKRFIGKDFKYSGSLYFTEDATSFTAAPSLYEHASEDDRTFCIGPSANIDFWEEERVDMEIDRGPCS